MWPGTRNGRAKVRTLLRRVLHTKNPRQFPPENNVDITLSHPPRSKERWLKEGKWHLTRFPKEKEGFGGPAFLGGFQRARRYFVRSRISLRLWSSPYALMVFVLFYRHNSSIKKSRVTTPHKK